MKKLLLLITLWGCAYFANSASFTLIMNFDNTARSFIVHLPTSYIAGQSLPLVFNHHGYTSNASQEELYTKMNLTSDANNFIVVYPEGLNNAWNSGFTAPYNSLPNDVGFISKIIDTMVTLYAINTDRVYSCGMSNGGFQSYRLACDLESRIAAVASVTGTIATLAATNCSLSRKVPVMHVHGTNDPTVPYAGFAGAYGVEETINFWLGKNGCTTQNDTVDIPNTNLVDGTTVKKIHYTNCADGAEVLFYKVAGGGHTWPSALIDIPASGPTNRDVDISQEIWDFFNRHTLSGTVGIKSAMQPTTNITAYPNPVENILTIQITDFTASANTAFTITDILGRVVVANSILEGTTSVDIAGLQNGIYLLQVAGNGFNKTIKISKQ